MSGVHFHHKSALGCMRVHLEHVSAHVEGFGLQSCKSLHPQLDANHIHTESAGKTEAISMCTDNKQPLNLVLTLKSQK